MSERNCLEKTKHACIIGLVATYSDEQHLYLLLELALGGELFQLMGHVGRRDFSEATWGRAGFGFGAWR